ncbi:hypothetical protein BH20VER3_BH20VER3_22470 [soil metagenome]
MIEPKQSVVAYWLIPAAPARGFFTETIRRLAQEYNGPIFEPHLTLAVGPDAPGEEDRAFAGLTLGPINLRSAGLAFTSKFTQTLFVRFEQSPELRRLRASLGWPEDRAFIPHLSLLYQKLRVAQRGRLAHEIRLPFATVTFDSVAATRCRVPVESAADVALWEIIARRPL